MLHGPTWVHLCRSVLMISMTTCCFLHLPKGGGGATPLVTCHQMLTLAKHCLTIGGRGIRALTNPANPPTHIKHVVLRGDRCMVHTLLGNYTTFNPPNRPSS